MTTVAYVGAPLASFGDRLGGQIADAIVATVPFFALLVVDLISERLADALVPLAVFLSAGYLWFSDGFSNGQSFGKRMVSTAVVDRDTGGPCSFGQSFVRNFLLTILGPIDWIFIFGDRRERLGDKAAGTRVIKLTVRGL